MKKIILFTIFYSLIKTSFPQTGLYKTYQDFIKGNIQELKTYKSYLQVLGSVTLKFEDMNGKNVKVKCNEIWGFVYEGNLFRMDIPNEQPARILHSGKIIYYQNGIAHLTLIHDKKKTSASYSVGYYDAVSKDLNSEIIPIPHETISAYKSKYESFKKKNPLYKTFFECMEKPYEPDQEEVDCLSELEKIK